MVHIGLNQKQFEWLLANGKIQIHIYYSNKIVINKENKDMSLQQQKSGDTSWQYARSTYGFWNLDSVTPFSKYWDLCFEMINPNNKNWSYTMTTYLVLGSFISRGQLNYCKRYMGRL